MGGRLLISVCLQYEPYIKGKCLPFRGLFKSEDGTIINADKIIVLEDGKIVGMGKHKDLLKSCDVYKQIALSQLSEEEL